MWFGLLGLVIGLVLGIFAPLAIPAYLARYTAVGIIGILDSILGAIKANSQHKFQLSIFITGLLTNMTLAMLITYLGDRLGLDLYLAVLVAFTIRMMTNVAVIRYAFLEKISHKHNKVGTEENSSK